MINEAKATATWVCYLENKGYEAQFSQCIGWLLACGADGIWYLVRSRVDAVKAFMTDHKA